MTSTRLSVSLVCVLTLFFNQHGNGQACDLRNYVPMDIRFRICTQNQPSVAGLYTDDNAGRQTINGSELLDIFDDYCGKLDEVHDCMRAQITSSGCGEDVFQLFVEKAAVSESVCQNGNVNPALTSIYHDLPPVGLFSSNNPCKGHVNRESHMCRNQVLAEMRASGVRGNIELVIRRIVESMPCALGRIISDQCPLQYAFMTTTLQYGAAVIPPKLGVNMTRLLSDMAQQYL